MRFTIKNLDKYLGFCSLTLLLLTIFIQVILRFVFSRPLMGAEEFTRYMVIGIVLYPLGFVEKSNSQIVMEDFQQKLPGKLSQIVHWAADIVSLAAYSVIAVSSVCVVINNINNETATLRMPFWLFFLPAVFGFSVLVITKLVMILKKGRS